MRGLKKMYLLSFKEKGKFVLLGDFNLGLVDLYK